MPLSDEPARRQLLLVDGDAQTRERLGRELRALGCQVVEAEGAEDALERYREGAPDAVITEVILPAGSGLELAAQISRDGRAPVLLSSAVVRTEEHQREACEKSGAHGFLVKPFSAHDILARLASLPAGTAAHRPDDLRPAEILLSPDAEEGGALGFFTYPLLLMSIFRKRETGVLSLERELTNRTLYFLQGVPVFVASANRQENLGRLLVERGRISEEDYQASTQMMQEKKIRQGEALVQLGLLTYQELYQALQDQAREKLIQGFGWQEGQYSFARTDSFLDKMTLLELDSHAAIAAGVGRFYPLEKLASIFEPLQESYPQVNEMFVRYFDRLDLSEAERGFAASLRGTDALRDMAGLPNVEIRDLLRILTILILCDMVTLRAEARSESSEQFTVSIGAPGESEDVSQQDMDKREVILENYLRVKSYNYFQILGVKHDASPELIKKQYEKLSKKYHPDHYKGVNLGPVAARLEEIYLKVELAYRTLSIPSNRSEYEGFLKRSEEIVLSDLSATLGAEMEFCRGQEALEAGDFDKAIDAFRVATEQNPLEPEYHTLLGVALFRSNPDRSLEARSHISRALAIDSNNASSLGELGRIYAFEGKPQMARRYFQAALRVKPNDETLKRDLAQIKQSEAPAEGA